MLGVALTLSIAALAIVGCGGGDDEQQGQLSKSHYQAAISDIVNDIAAPTSLYIDLVRPRPQGECASMMRTFYDEVNDLVERVAALQPPANVASIQDAFVTAARRSVERLGAIRDQVAAGQVSCGRPLNDRLYGMPSSNQAQHAMSKLQNQGYIVLGE